MPYLLWLEVNVYCDGKEYYQRFENGGTPVAPLKELGHTDKQGTRLLLKQMLKVLERNNNL